MENRVLGTFLARAMKSAGLFTRSMALDRHTGWRGKDRVHARGEYGKGRCVVSTDSSLKKRMRAARKGTWVPMDPTPKEQLHHAARRKELRV